MPIDHCLTQPSSEMLPPAVEGNKYRDPQLDSVQSIKNLGKLSPKWIVFIKSLLLGFREEEEVESLEDA